MMFFLHSEKGSTASMSGYVHDSLESNSWVIGLISL